MANVTITDLTAGGAITDAVLFEAENPAATTSTKQTALQIATYVATKGTALTKVDDTNVTLTLGGAPSTALLNAASLTLGWTGQLSLARGGTGANLTDPNADRVLFWDDSAGQVTWLTMGTNLTITGTTLDASGGGGTPGGSDTQVQFNDSSAFGGDSGLTYNKTTNVLTHTASNNDGSTAPITVLPSSGASFTKIFDNGTMIIDSDSGTGTIPLTLKYNGTTQFTFSYQGALTLPGSTASVLMGSGAGIALVYNSSGGGNAYIEIAESVAAVSGTANAGRLFCVDSGGGKTILKVLFGSGAAQTIATEP